MEVDKNWHVDFPDEFFTGPFRLRLDLDIEQFDNWREWFFKELVKCENWACSIQSETHGLDELCGGSSTFGNYKKLAEELANDLDGKVEGEVYYPVFDPIYAHHLDGTEWVEIENGVEKPVTTDPISNWSEWFPKRSCITCNGREGIRSEKICKHKEGSENCKKSCYRQVFESWCPIMNTFIEKTGQLINRDLEKYLKAWPVHFIPDVDQLDEEGLRKSAPEPIREYLQRVFKKGENDEQRNKSNFN